ncbi:MAG: leucine-rich repeat domain-containing protein, partial [Myxococcota bacterium]
VLYFVPRGQVKPPPDLGRSRLTLSVSEVLEHAALFPGLSSLESLTLKLDEADVDKALRIIGSAPALTHLTVSGTIAQLPRSIGAMRTLTGLNLRGLGLESVPDSLGDLAALEFLNLAGNRLNTLPHSLKQLNRLDSLNLSENPVNDLSIEFAELEALEELNLMGTALRELPEVVFALPALQRLYLGNSAIREIPGRIGALGRLTGLNIANLELESLPDGFWELTSLGGLTAEGNRFGNNASGFQWQRLTALKLVNVRACGLEVVPEAFGELPELVRIDLRDNRIATVPEQLRRKPLDWIGLQGNPHGYGRSDFNAKAIGL